MISILAPFMPAFCMPHRQGAMIMVLGAAVNGGVNVIIVSIDRPKVLEVKRMWLELLEVIPS